MIYTRPVQLYEMDGMGIVHHAQYLHYLEEARLFAMKEKGYGYERLLEMGLASPVMNVSAEYRKTSAYPDILKVDIRLTEYNGVTFRFAYVITNGAGDTVFTGETRHCLIGASGLPERIPRRLPEVDSLMRTWLAEDTAN
ncbi:MAG: acyl-CoA thioesterase [Clostridia bacterium]|nr:acyl-CoA thioesterase [Clostridia bacterium]